MLDHSLDTHGVHWAYVVGPTAVIVSFIVVVVSCVLLCCLWLCLRARRSRRCVAINNRRRRRVVGSSHPRPDLETLTHQRDHSEVQENGSEAERENRNVVIDEATETAPLLSAPPPPDYDTVMGATNTDTHTHENR